MDKSHSVIEIGHHYESITHYKPFFSLVIETVLEKTYLLG